jgi:glycosyltransferase involved in cell wall biosynthesis
MPESVAALARPGLKVLGHVPDLRPLLQTARVSIAPLRYGAGVKGKVNEAMNFGIPVVATSTAVEGMHLTDGQECLMTDDPRRFAEYIVELHRNRELWQRLSEAGVRSVEQHFSFNAVRNNFLNALGLVDAAHASSPPDLPKLER